jgi:beta-galactosidase/beta-glucuronidase
MAAVVCVFSESGFGEELASDINSSGYKQSLNGTWEFRLDPQGTGEKQRWWEDKQKGTWEEVEVPSSFNLYEKHLKKYQGRGWYRKTFKINKALKRDERVILRFLGVPIRAKVWLNNHLLGEHLFPYTAFEFDATEQLHPAGENVLVVLADNELLEWAIPDTKCTGWWICGGICRDVYLEVRPTVAITNLWLDAKMTGKSWEFDVAAVVTNYGQTPQTLSMTAVLRDLKGEGIWRRQDEVTLAPGENKVALRGSSDEVKPWSPASPTLYELTATILSADMSGVAPRRSEASAKAEEGQMPYSRTIKTGFRQIEVRGSEIFLNGKKILLKGLSRHELFAGLGSIVPRERTLADVKDIKELGCNFLRTAHYTQHPYLYELCDEMGLLVWTEIPAWQSNSQVLGDTDVIEKWGKAQIAEMINQYRRYPCVVVWSVGNEFDSANENVVRYVKETTEFVRQMDATRLVSYASNRHKKDICYKYADFIAINEYYGWYHGEINDVGPYLDWLHEKYPDKPILVSEFGSGATTDTDPNRSKWPTNDQGCFSFDCQVRFLREHLEQIFAPQRRDYVAGGLVWLYNDFDNFNESGFYKRPAKWTDVNLKGLVTIDRQHKPSFDMVKQYFNLLE